MDEYKPVPVDAARQIGQHFKKGVVAILSIDRNHDLMHVTTWGQTAQDKFDAAALGDLLAQHAGADLSQKIGFEDFRTRSAADSAAIIDRLSQEVRELRQLIGDAHWVAVRKFSRWGLCDAIDNDGKPYPSQSATDLIRRIQSEAVQAEVDQSEAGGGDAG